jgi:nicotinamide mononucleotide (NMN) deamidase PncC
METAIEMSEKISLFANANYGVGITGKLNRVDKNNTFGEDNIVFISIYDKDNDKHYNYKMEATEKSRCENKALVINYIVNNLKKIINN